MKEFLKKHESLVKETVIVSIIILTLSLFSLFSLFYKTPALEEGETINKVLGLESVVYGGMLVALSVFLFYWTHPGSEERIPPLKTSKIIIFGILSFLGVCAYVVLVQIMSSYLHFMKGWSFFLASGITLTYIYLMVKMYFFDRVDSKKLFWELVRFALVGVIAALFDFSTVYLMRFAVLKSLTNSTAVTFIAVTCGFLVGVAVNYLCSVYMVYKSESGLKKSKTAKGVILFVGLSAVGLFIGIGLEALFFDFLKWVYIAVFIIRTLVVLVWNYITRKIFIFK